MAVKCANNGCGQLFNPEENNDTACIHHSGTAVFHEGMKGWSCCKKRVISFEEFMDIPGCSCAAHVAEQKKSQPEPKPASQPPPPVAAPTSTPTPAPSSAPVSSHKPNPPAKPAPAPVEEEFDPPDAIIKPGTKCTRLACNQIYHDERSKTERCTYHPGVPVFHEGSKGYNCCKMVGDFNEFLKMPGCKKSTHKFVEVKKLGSNKIECRHDWYQMGPNVVVCVYAKGIDKQKSTVTFGPNTLDVELVLPEDKSYSRTFKLSQGVDPEKCKYEFLSTKVEIKLYKTEGSQWAALE